MQTRLINSIQKAFGVLNILVFQDQEHKGFSLAELSKRTQLASNTLHNILRTMIFCGYVQQGDNSRYYAGKLCRQMGVMNNYQIPPKVDDAIRNHLQALSTDIKESVMFFLLRDGERQKYLHIKCEDIIKVDHSMMIEHSIYYHPTGRVLTAYADTEELELIIQKFGLPSQNWDDISTREELKTALEEIRTDGFCIRETREGKVINFGVPILLAQGQLLGAIGVYMPAFRSSQEKRKDILIKMKTAAEAIAGDVK